MILRAIAIFAFLTPSILLGQSDTTATAPSALAAASSDPFNSEGVVFSEVKTCGGVPYIRSHRYFARDRLHAKAVR